jgi:hypothetical protein
LATREALVVLQIRPSRTGRDVNTHALLIELAGRTHALPVDQLEAGCTRVACPGDVSTVSAVRFAVLARDCLGLKLAGPTSHILLAEAASQHKSTVAGVAA